jgi:hypothetical protein
MAPVRGSIEEISAQLSATRMTKIPPTIQETTAAGPAVPAAASEATTTPSR